MAVESQSRTTEPSGTEPGAAAGSWLSWLLLAGLVAVLLGERLLGDKPSVRLALTSLGGAAVLGAAIARAFVWARSSAERRSVQGLLALGYAGIVIALHLYAAGTGEAVEALGIKFADAEARSRYEGAVTALWPILLLCSMLPILFAEFAWMPMRQAQRVEARRVQSAGAAGLTIGLASAFLMLAGFVASERDMKSDQSYFKTSRPGEATINIAKSFAGGDPLEIVLFFPEVNEVRDEALGYAHGLAAAVGAHVKVLAHDRLMAPKLAEKYRVTKDGMLVLSRGDKNERFTLETEMESARKKLRTLDAEVQKMLLKLARARRTAYLTTGHGELNDPAKGVAERALPRGGAESLKKLLEMQNLTVKNLGLTEGLGNEVPEDATIVMVLGPTEALMPEETDTLARYLRRGGHLLLAIDPESKADLGALSEALGVTLAKTQLANEQIYVRGRFNDSDHALLATNRFSSHAAVTTLSRHSRELATIFPGAGSIERRKEEGGKTPSDGLSVDFVIRSMTGTFADANGNFKLDRDGGEKQDSFNLAATVSRKLTAVEKAAAAPQKKETPSAKDDKKKDAEKKKEEEPELRALVMADADAIGDIALGNLANLHLASDAIRWLGGEEEFAGETESEEDVKIQHTRKENVIWFYATTFLVPALVLGGGLTFAMRTRRRSRTRRAS